MADIEENARRKAAGKKEIPLSPIAIEIVRRIDALFEIERSVNGRTVEERLIARQTLSRPLVEELQVYMVAIGGWYVRRVLHVARLTAFAVD